MHCHHHHRAKHIRINLAQIADSKRATDSDNALMPANNKWEKHKEMEKERGKKCCRNETNQILQQYLS